MEGELDLWLFGVTVGHYDHTGVLLQASHDRNCVLQAIDAQLERDLGTCISVGDRPTASRRLPLIHVPSSPVRHVHASDGE